MSGLKYPLSALNGGLELVSSEEDSLRGAVQSSVQTYKGERVLRPQYGIEPQLFEVVSDFGAYYGGIEADIDNSLTDYKTVLTKLTGSLISEGVVNILLQYTTEGLQTESLSIDV